MGCRTLGGEARAAGFQPAFDRRIHNRNRHSALAGGGRGVVAVSFLVSHFVARDDGADLESAAQAAAGDGSIRALIGAAVADGARPDAWWDLHRRMGPGEGCPAGVRGSDPDGIRLACSSADTD